MIREVGTLVQLSVVVRDLAGNPVNTATVTCSLTKPDGSVTAAAVTNTAAGGLYTATVTPDQAGLWRYTFTAAGTVVLPQSDQFCVVASQRALVASLEEFKLQLNRAGASDISDDAELRSYLVAATDWVEYEIGGPLTVTTITEWAYVRATSLAPMRQPLVSVTSITPDLGTALDPSAYQVDTDRRVIRFRWDVGRGWYTLVYRAGLTAVAQRHLLAGTMVAQHLWQTQNGGGGLPFPGDNDTTPVPGLGFSVPNRAKELLGPDTAAAAGFA